MKELTAIDIKSAMNRIDSLIVDLTVDSMHCDDSEIPVYEELIDNLLKLQENYKPMKSLEEYLKNPDNCPFCDHDVVGGNGFDTHSTAAYREIECNRCGKKWTETFTITNIEEVKNDN